jgi:hypothetical protein
MASAPTLFEPPAADGNLTYRQALVLDLVRSWPEGVRADEASAAWHERRGVHSTDTRCLYCASDGRSVLFALRRRGLVVRRRSGMWTQPGRRERPQAVGQTTTIPF